MRIQDAVMRVLPARLVAPPGMAKARMRAVLLQLAATDLRPDLARISAPTLVLCGGRDRPNLSAAQLLAAEIPGAELQVVPGAGHEWNTQLPEEFSARIGAFYGSLGDAARG